MSYQQLRDEVRALRKLLMIERRRNLHRMVVGTVAEVKGSQVRVKIAEDGRKGEVLSPWLSIADRSGERDKGVSTFTKFGIGEAVLVVSPNGALGKSSAVQPWVDTKKDPAPGKAEADGHVRTIGDARWEIRKGYARLKIDGSSIEITPSMIWLRTGGSEIAIEGGKITAITPHFQHDGEQLRHNAKNVGDTHGHETAPPGPPGPPLP